VGQMRRVTVTSWAVVLMALGAAPGPPVAANAQSFDWSGPSKEMTWLHCNWTTERTTDTAFGMSSKESKSEQTWDKIFVFSANAKALFDYNSEKKSLNLIPDALIYNDSVGYEIKDDYRRSEYSSKTNISILINRKTLEITESGGDENDTVMGDGRIFHLTATVVGQGRCEIIGPLYVAPELPNKF